VILGVAFTMASRWSHHGLKPRRRKVMIKFVVVVAALIFALAIPAARAQMPASKR
jgi:hypothetical protein